MISRSRLLVVPAAVFAALLCVSQTAGAASIPVAMLFTFQDNSGSATLSAPGGPAVSGLSDVCALLDESCAIIYNRPGFHVVSISLNTSSGPLSGALGAGNWSSTELDASGTLADRILAGQLPSFAGTGVEVAYFSQGTSNPCLTSLSGCITTESLASLNQVGVLGETGFPQVGASILWADNTNASNTVTDVFDFVTEAQAVQTPEPASLLLLGTGLVAVGARLRRRKVNA